MEYKSTPILNYHNLSSVGYMIDILEKKKKSEGLKKKELDYLNGLYYDVGIFYSTTKKI